MKFQRRVDGNHLDLSRTLVPPRRNKISNIQLSWSVLTDPAETARSQTNTTVCPSGTPDPASSGGPSLV